MRTNRSAAPTPPAPISAGVAGRARRATDAVDDGDGRALLLRIVALLGIGLVAAAVLLPSGEAAVVIPPDALQPAGSVAGVPESTPADDDAGADPEPSQPPAAGATSAFGASSASVGGDELARATAPAKQKPAPNGEAAGDSAMPKQAGPRARAAPKRPTSKRKARSRKRSSSRSATPSPRPAAPAVAAPAPPPAPAPAPPPRRARGGPKAEFGGL